MNDVEQRLRRLTREVPVAGGELDHVVGRGRVVRRRRAVTSAGAGVAVLVAAITVMSVLARPEPLPYVENSPAPSASASPSASPASPADGAIDIAQVALPLGLVDDAGLHPNDLADAPEVDAELTAVVADGSGGVLYQRADDPRSIHWRHADGSEEDPVTVQPGPTTLVGAVRWDGALYVAFTVPETDSEVPAVRLMLHRRPEPGSGDLLVTYTTDLVVDGDVPGVALLPDGRLVTSACHLACTSHTVDLVEAAAGREDLAATAVDDNARMTWGLDGTHQGSLVTVESELPGPLGAASLEVFGLDGDDPSRTELPVDEGDTGAAVQATSDGRAAIVELWDTDGGSRWLLVDELDTPAPRIRTITGVDGRLVLLDEPATGP